MNTNDYTQKQIIARGMYSAPDKIDDLHPKVVGAVGNDLMDTLDITLDEVCDRKLRVLQEYSNHHMTTHIAATAELCDTEWAVLKMCGYPKKICVTGHEAPLSATHLHHTVELI